MKQSISVAVVLVAWLCCMHSVQCQRTALELLRQNQCICPCGNPAGGKQYFISNKLLNWFDAVSYCNAIGMSIASVKDNLQNSKLQQYLRESYRITRSAKYWIGANNLSKDRSMQWGLSGIEVTFNAWAFNEPSQTAPYCVYLEGSTMKWKSEACGAGEKLFICEY
ncbi:C-type lectin 37Db-like [Anopheles cruzii]|uniref:C-type lectin 37Db-like n=1 Tax=Anopheles cruzii TaxID=68878 RepID=UPI0022EC3E47|nr:C-type lectin 37Db-like [Anopheles cruzii]